MPGFPKVGIVGALTILAAAACGPQSGVTPATSPTSPVPFATSSPVLSGRIGAAGGPGAAANLRATAHCEAAGSRAAVADLSWTVAAQRGSQEGVALTKFADGFETGQYEVSAALPPDGTAFSWRGLSPGGVHFWRVLTLHGEVWTPSAVESFTGPTCVADYVPTPSQ